MNGMRARRGHLAHHAGLAAERQILRHYLAAGLSVVAQRWRGGGGEIDLVVRDGDRYVFVEVKSARDRAMAALRLSPGQIRRLAAAAQAFVAACASGLAVEMRFDVALVDRQGQVEILENALIDG